MKSTSSQLAHPNENDGTVLFSASFISDLTTNIFIKHFQLECWMKFARKTPGNEKWKMRNLQLICILSIWNNQFIVSAESVYFRKCMNAMSYRETSIYRFFRLHPVGQKLSTTLQLLSSVFHATHPAATTQKSQLQSLCFSGLRLVLTAVMFASALPNAGFRALHNRIYILPCKLTRRIIKKNAHQATTKNRRWYFIFSLCCVS